VKPKNSARNLGKLPINLNDLLRQPTNSPQK